MPKITEDEVKAFVARCQKIVDDHTAAHFSGLIPDLLTFDYGSAKKYCRIVSTKRYKGDNPGEVTVTDQRSCWCFVDLETGDVLKSDGWKRPAKHARGNIKDENLSAFISAYGPAYLK